jgi:hypothetical protein
MKAPEISVRSAICSDSKTFLAKDLNLTRTLIHKFSNTRVWIAIQISPTKQAVHIDRNMTSPKLQLNDECKSTSERNSST